MGVMTHVQRQHVPAVREVRIQLLERPRELLRDGLPCKIVALHEAREAVGGRLGHVAISRSCRVCCCVCVGMAAAARAHDQAITHSPTLSRVFVVSGNRKGAAAALSKALIEMRIVKKSSCETR